MNESACLLMILLGINVDHVATIRQARYRDETNTHGGFVEPDPAAMAWLAMGRGLIVGTVTVASFGRRTTSPP